MNALRLQKILVVPAFAVALLTVSPILFAQSAMTATVQPRQPYYIDPTVMDLPALIPNPPIDGSPELREDFAELHHIESSRTPTEMAAAKADDVQENLFLFKSVMGDHFNAATLPITSELGLHIQNEVNVAGGPLKLQFHRVRPYIADKSLHPICGLTSLPSSYPSGHALVGYLDGLTLAEMVPEKRVAILARADDFAHNRLVCGVHYPSDVEASRKIAYVVFGYMLATPRFQRDLAAARSELRSALGLPPQ